MSTLVVPSGLFDAVTASAIGVGSLAAAAALYGRHRILPSFLTGPRVCRLEAGGCQVLFRTPKAALLGVPNATLALVLYAGLVVGTWLRWPTAALLVGASLALAMSVYLAHYLVSRDLECRICWVGHAANLVLWLSLLARVGTGRA